MRKEKKAKFPCDNCGQYRHWKYQPMCLNYSKHLETMQQAAAAYRAGAGRSSSGNQRSGDGVGSGTGHRHFQQDIYWPWITLENWNLDSS
jgi:hypothetical protein